MGEPVFQYHHRVVFAECTVGNHVYYSRYLDMLEAARGEFLRHLGWTLRQLQEAGVIFPVIGVELSYKAPARYDDLLTVELWINELGGVRLNVGCRILREDGTLLVEGETRHVCATTAEKPTRIPRELATKLQAYVRKSEASTRRKPDR